MSPASSLVVQVWVCVMHHNTLTTSETSHEDNGNKNVNVVDTRSFEQDLNTSQACVVSRQPLPLTPLLVSVWPNGVSLCLPQHLHIILPSSFSLLSGKKKKKKKKPRFVDWQLHFKDLPSWFSRVVGVLRGGEKTPTEAAGYVVGPI